MIELQSLTPDANVAVIGASGGIGRAFVDLLAQDSGTGAVHAFARTPIAADRDNVHPGTIDVTDEDSVREAAAAATSQGPLDLVVVTVGILHRGEDIRPEKSMRDLDARMMLDVFALNTVGPAIVAKHFLPRLRRGHKTVFAALSARVGSIGDNRLGGWASYRASKAALNMLLRTLAIEQRRRWPDSLVVALHPGTVDTPLSRPFTSRVPESRLFSPTRSATHLLGVLDSLTPEETGGFFAWDGSAVEF